ncbi:MAG: DUF1080 domain-containing protein [Planctomycetes bacterium]|nr:DUF1080 domain-containing protein [Planctomycetota bacterium]
MFRGTLFALCALGLASQTHAGGDKWINLFNGKDLAGWKTNVFGKDQGKTFTVEQDYIKVSGNPGGYFYTEKSYKNYVLSFDWRYKRPDNLDDEAKFSGNSGLLVHIQAHGKGWPNSLEVQGENRNHASFIAIKGKEGKDVGLTNVKFDKKTLEKVRKPVGQWNTTEVTINNGDVAVKVNGTPISSAKFALNEGPFGFQSEGAELHFKNIKIKLLSDSPSTKKEEKKTEEKKVVKTEEKKTAKTDEKKTEAKKLPPATTTPTQPATPSEIEIMPERRGLFPNLRARLRSLFRRG